LSILPPERYSEIGLSVNHFDSSAVYIKHANMQLGNVLQGHQHITDHLSVLIVGRVRVTVDGVATEYGVKLGACPIAITIASGRHHKIESLEDGTDWLCIHQIPIELRGSIDIDSALIKE
jgi:mannose-6-phosphate isomerase-like protein (cupin superfamily)